MKSIKFLALLCAAIFSMSIVSCSKDDNNEEEAQAQRILDCIKSQVLDASGAIAFCPTEIDGVYAAPVENNSDAYGLCAGLIDTKFEGENYVFTLPAAKGVVTIKKSNKDGYYCSVNINVAGIPSFQLDMMNPQAFNDSNGITPRPGYSSYYTKCVDCGWMHWLYYPPYGVCPKCGGSVVKITLG